MLGWDRGALLAGVLLAGVMLAGVLLGGRGFVFCNMGLRARLLPLPEVPGGCFPPLCSAHMCAVPPPRSPAHPYTSRTPGQYPVRNVHVRGEASVGLFKAVDGGEGRSGERGGGAREGLCGQRKREENVNGAHTFIIYTHRGWFFGR